MTRAEAEKTLSQHGYVPGKSNTRGMPEPARSEVKAALRAIRAAEMAEVQSKAEQPKVEAPARTDKPTKKEG